MWNFGRRRFLSDTLAVGAVLPGVAGGPLAAPRETGPHRSVVDAAHCDASPGAVSFPRIAHFSINSSPHEAFNCSFREYWHVPARMAEVDDDDRMDLEFAICCGAQEELHLMGTRHGQRFMEMYDDLEQDSARHQPAAPVDIAAVFVEPGNHYWLAAAEVLIDAFRRKGAFTLWATVTSDEADGGYVLPLDEIDAATRTFGDARFLFRPNWPQLRGEPIRSVDWITALAWPEYHLVSLLDRMFRHPELLRCARNALRDIRHGWIGLSSVRPWHRVSESLIDALSSAKRRSLTPLSLGGARYIEVAHGPNVPLDRLSDAIRERIPDRTIVCFRPFRISSKALTKGLDVFEMLVFGEGEPVAGEPAEGGA